MHFRSHMGTTRTIKSLAEPFIEIHTTTAADSEILKKPSFYVVGSGQGSGRMYRELKRQF